MTRKIALAATAGTHTVVVSNLPEHIVPAAIYAVGDRAWRSAPSATTLSKPLTRRLRTLRRSSKI